MCINCCVSSDQSSQKSIINSKCHHERTAAQMFDGKLLNHVCSTSSGHQGEEEAGMRMNRMLIVFAWIFCRPRCCHGNGHIRAV